MSKQTEKQDREATYNGWSNYPTWAVKLWMDNEPYSEEFWQKQTVEARKEANRDATIPQSDKRNRAIRILSDSLEAEHELEASALNIPNGIYSDLLTNVLAQVNWREIAESLIEDYEDENPEEEETEEEEEEEE